MNPAGRAPRPTRRPEGRGVRTHPTSTPIGLGVRSYPCAPADSPHSVQTPQGFLRRPFDPARLQRGEGVVGGGLGGAMRTTGRCMPEINALCSNFSDAPMQFL